MTPEEQAITEATAMLVDEKNNTITYINPNETDDENVNVYEKFNHVPEDAWYETYHSHLVQLGVIRGVSEDGFAPNDYVTRAQFATMLAFASDADLTAYQGITSFSDVSVFAWYAPQVEWAYRQGLIKGRADGLFYPESDITREEAVAVIDRYAVSENSSIFDDYQYELDDNANKYLTDKEIGFLETALAPPVYDDEINISSWAAEDIDAMSKAGIICGNEDGNFNPQGPISRVEPNNSGQISVSWAKTGHITLTDFAFELLKQDTGEGGRAKIYNKMKDEIVPWNNLRPSGMTWVKTYAWYTDEIENYDAYLFHFYDPDTGWSYVPGSSRSNACMYFNNHFYNAYTSYLNGNKYAAYTELGMSIHYLEDLNNSYHASNHIAVVTNHTEYEAWVDANVVATATTSMTYDSCRYMYDTDFIMIANNFAGLAKGTYNTCQAYDRGPTYESSAKVATLNNLTRTERAVTGLLNRFYDYGWLNH